MELLKSLGNSIGTSLKKFFMGTSQAFISRTIVGRLSPYIGSDNKTQYVQDFEQIKYVYAVISWIATKAAKVPFALYKQKGDGSKDLIKMHLLLRKLEKPNNYQSRFQFLYQAYGYLLSTGALYVYIEKLSSGRWAEMHVIPSNFVTPVYEKTFEGPARFIVNDTGRTIERKDMMFIYYDSLDFEQVGVGEDGMSPLNSLRTVTQKTKDIDASDLALIQNGGVAGIITDKTATENMDTTQREKAEKLIEQKVYGPGNRGKWFMTSGDVSFIPIGQTSVDLNLYEANKQVLRDICIVYHIPYIIFDQTDTNASFGTAMKEAKKQAYTDAVLPLVELFVDGINHFDISGFDKDLILDYDTSQIEELQTDAKVQAETLAIQYWKPIDQKQRESGIEIDPKYKGVYLVPSNLVRMEDFDVEAAYQKARQGMKDVEQIFE